MLNEPDIPLIPVNRLLARTCHRGWQHMPSCVMININSDSIREQNTILISKKSALTVSQKLSINQQQEIGKTGLALAGSCQ